MLSINNLQAIRWNGFKQVLIAPSHSTLGKYMQKIKFSNYLTRLKITLLFYCLFHSFNYCDKCPACFRYKTLS